MNQTGEPEDKRAYFLKQWAQQQIAYDSSIDKTLSQLNIKIEELPQSCQELLCQVNSYQEKTAIRELDPVYAAIIKNKTQADILNLEYEILKLTQQNEIAQEKIDRNEKFLNELKRELVLSREKIGKVGLDDIPENMRLLKQKVASYDESCEKAKAKFMKLQLPEMIMPKQLLNMTELLSQLRQEEADLKLRAEEVLMERQARATLQRLRR